MRRFPAVCVIVLYGTLSPAMPNSVAAQAKPPLVGTVSPRAIGAPAPTATPVGGLTTRPIPPAGARGARGTGVSVVRGAERLGGVIPLAVADAPNITRGVVVSPPDDRAWNPAVARAYWTPTAERPRWVRDSSVAPVQAWRDLIVSDVVCNPVAVCLERQQRVRAPWIAACGCYAFADGLNRIWRVDRRE